MDKQSQHAPSNCIATTKILIDIPSIALSQIFHYSMTDHTTYIPYFCNFQVLKLISFSTQYTIASILCLMSYSANSVQVCLDVVIMSGCCQHLFSYQPFQYSHFNLLKLSFGDIRTIKYVEI